MAQSQAAADPSMEEILASIRKIIAEAAKYLNPGGRLLLEMDPRQTSEVVATLEACGHYEGVRRIEDYSHRYRVVLATKRKHMGREPRR